MENKDMELMKKLIEEKKKKGSEQSNKLRSKKVIGKQKGASRSTKKTGGLFDK